MSEFTDAFTNLLRVADTGREYLRSEVMTPGGLDTDETMARPFGTGLDFERTVTVPDQSTDDTVEATLRLRVIHANGTGASDNPEPTPFDGLYIRARLEWTNSAGDEHVSAVSYLMPADKLAEMDNAPDLEAKYANAQITDDTPPDTAAEIAGQSLGDTMDLIGLFGAMWQQRYPADISEMFDELREDDPDWMARFEANTAHHEHVIEVVQDAEPLLACMIIDGQMGTPYAREISLVWRWVAQQSEVAAA